MTTLTPIQRILAFADATFTYAEELREQGDERSDFYEGKAVGLLQAAEILRPEEMPRPWRHLSRSIHE